MKNFRYLLFLLMLYVCNVSYAIHFKHIGSENGLSHPTVLSIYQDSIGRVWLGTSEGICVYDGNRLTAYKPYQKNTSQLFPGEVIKEITSLSGNDIFFVTNKALVKYDIRRETFSTVWERSRIHSIFSGGDVIWIAVSHELYLWDSHTQKLSLRARLPFDTSKAILVDDKHRKWFATSNGIYRTENDIDFKRISTIPNVVSLFEAKNGDVWAGTRDDGLLRILPDGRMVQYNAQNSFSKGLQTNNIRQIAEDSSSNIWFGTSNGLYEFNLSSNTFKNYNQKDESDGIGNSSIYPVFINNEDVLWIGTYFNGANYASIKKENSFVFYNSLKKENHLSSPIVGSMVEDNGGNIWICTEGGGLNVLDMANGHIKHFTGVNNRPLPQTNLKSILYDAVKDLLYIGTNSDGLYTYDVQRGKFEQKIVADRDTVNSIGAMARDGDHLFFSSKGGIYLYSLSNHDLSLIYRSSEVASAHLRIGTDHCLWVVEDCRVLLFDIKTCRLVKRYDLGKQGIYSRIIRTFQSASGDNYICTFGNGVMKLDAVSGQFVPFPSEASPVPSSYCYQMGETPNGNLIVTGDKGITIICEKNGMQKSLFLEEYFPLNAFMRDCGLFISHDGTIYAGGINGLVSFSESELSIHPESDDLYFTKLYVHENPVSPNDGSGILTESLPFVKKITLTHTQNKIELQFASKEYASILSPQVYEYILHGMDDTWYKTVHKSISYTNLTPGSYLLEVRKKIYTADNADTLKMRIIVLPPWYATWWAWIIWTVLLLLFVVGIVCIWVSHRKMREAILKEQIESQQLRKMDEAKFRFFTSVSHEFRTPLSLIIGQLELVLQNYKITSPVSNKLTKVINQTQYLNNLVTELIEFRKYEQEQMTIKVASYSINHYVSQIYENFKELASHLNIKYTLQLCEEDAEVWFDGRQMQKVFYNLLSNAFKYTPKNGEIGIQLLADRKANLLYVRVVDNGVGINSEEMKHIFDRFYQADNQVSNATLGAGAGIGLALTKSIVEAHKGTIEVKSQTGYGTIFTVTLLLGIEHLRNDKHVTFEKYKGLDFTLFPPVRNLMETSVQGEKDEDRGFVNEGKADIVIVEDNAEMADILVDLFSPFYNVQTADNGEKGYDLIREIKPSLVISDVMMPVMTGTELCTKLKSDLDLCNIPIILLTALDMPEQTIDGLRRGADDYICKPFNAQVLLARCNNLIASRRLLGKMKMPDAEFPMMATNKLDQEFMEKVISVVDKNLDTEFNNDQLAVEMCMSRSAFYNKFKVLTGMSPNDFINSYKLKKAVVMLKDEAQLPITEIADRLGYNSVNYFSRKFKMQFGITPSNFRKKGSEESENCE